MSARKQDSNVGFQFPAISSSFDAQAFDDALRAHGVKLIHWRAMKCPVGLVDKYDHRRVHEDHSGCSNGHLYTEAGSITGTFIANSEKVEQSEIGLLDGGSVNVTVPRTYDDNECPPDIAPFDRFYLSEDTVTVPAQQLAESHITGKDKLSYPVVKVLDIIDSQGKRYSPDDLTLDTVGCIVWNPGKGPGFNAETNKGTIYSIRYTYRPYWYVDRMQHQVRVAQVDDGDGRVLMRMPQQFVLTREYVFEKSDRDNRAPNPNSPRQVKGPRAGVFGPR